MSHTILHICNISDFRDDQGYSGTPFLILRSMNVAGSI